MANTPSTSIPAHCRHCGAPLTVPIRSHGLAPVTCPHCGSSEVVDHNVTEVTADDLRVIRRALCLADGAPLRVPTQLLTRVA